MLGLFIFLFVDLIIFSMYYILFLYKPKGIKLKSTEAEVVMHGASGKLFYPIVEFKHKGRLVRCGTKRLKYKYKSYMFLGKIIKISYCENSMDSDLKRCKNKPDPIYSYNTIATIEDCAIKEMLIKKDKNLKLLFNVFLKFSIFLTISFIFLEFVLK